MLTQQAHERTRVTTPAVSTVVECIHFPILQQCSLAMTSQNTIYCFGCGSNITDRPTDRRALVNPRSQYVVQLWKAFLEGRDQPVDDADKDPSGRGGQSSCKMCRKFFLPMSVVVKFMPPFKRI